MTTYTLQDLMYAKGTSEPVRQALQAQAAEIERLKANAEAINEWLQKTEWVQDSAEVSELGMHRADVLKQRIERLHQLITKLHTAKGRYHTQLAACDLFDAVGLKNERPVK